jgi:hypothetical protein
MGFCTGFHPSVQLLAQLKDGNSNGLNAQDL